MGASQSSSAANPAPQSSDHEPQIKECFTKTLQHELLANGRTLKEMNERELEAHFKRVLSEKCMKPMGIDIAKDEWASVMLKHSACAFTKAIKNGCADPGVEDRRKCAREAGVACLSQAANLREKAVEKPVKPKASSKHSSKKKPSKKPIKHSSKKSSKKSSQKSSHKSITKKTKKAKIAQKKKKPVAKKPKKSPAKGKTSASKKR